VKGLAFVAVSLDGFIARSDGSVDWLDMPESNEDYGFSAFMDSIDAMVMGRNTFDTVMAMREWPYRDTPVIVLTHRSFHASSGFEGLVETMDALPADVAAELDRRGLDRVYIDGGQVIQSFLNTGLLHRMVITTIPVLLGDGIPLFGPTNADVLLRHVDTVAYTDGLVQSTYDVV
jgi:dihydrofolate reductase